MADERVVRTIFRYEHDRRTYAETLKASAAFRSEIIAVADTIKTKFASEALKATEITRKMGEQLAKTARTKEIDALGNQFGALAKKIKDSEAAAGLLAKKLLDIGASESEVERATAAFARTGGVSGTGAFGRAAAGFGAVASLAGGIGGGALAEPVRIAAQISQVGEQLPRLAQGVGDLAQEATSAVPLVGKLAGGIASAVPALGGAGAAIVALGAVALPIAAVIAGIALALGELSRISEEAKAQVQAQVEASKARIAIEREVTNFLKAGDKEGAKARLDDLQGQQEDANKLLTDLYVRRDAVNKAYAALGSAFDPGQRQALAARAGELDAEIKKNFDAGFEARAKEQDAIKAALPAITERAKAEEARVEREKALADAEKELTTARERSAATLKALNEQTVQAQEQASARALELAQDRRIRDQNEEEDWQDTREKALTAHNARLADIEKAGQEKVEAINKELDSLPAERVAAVKDAEDKAAGARDKINRDFMQAELNALQKFRDEEGKRTRDFNKQRTRDLDDLHDSLLDAESANDVVRFIQTQKEGEKRLSRQQQDFDDETRDRDAAFIAEREAARSARQERLAEVQSGLGEELASINAQFVERRAKLAEQVEAEKVAIQQRLDAEKVAFDASEAQETAARDKRLRRQQEADDLADKRAQAALDKQLAKITEKENAELAALDAVIARTNALRIGSEIPKASTSAGGPKLTAFQHGGIVTRPTLGFFEGKEPELVLPLSKARGFGGTTVVVNMNGTNIGEVASPDDVRRIGTQIGEEVLDIMAQGIQQARYGAQ